MQLTVRPSGRILFGRGTADAVAEVVRGIGDSVLLCSDEAVLSQPAADAIVERLRETSANLLVFPGAEAELPISCVQAALEASHALEHLDVVVGLGGGSAIDLAKLVSLLRTHQGPLDRYYGDSLVPGPCIPVVAVPTTAGTGSEVTPVAVVGDPTRILKVGVSSPFLVPRAAICDPELSLTCPPRVTAFSGIDAVAHAVEAFTASRRTSQQMPSAPEVFQGKNEISDLFALEAIRRISASLERAVSDGADLVARESMLFGSLCAGIAFGTAGTAGAHALQYAVGAATRTPHGLGVGLLLPFVLSFTRPACTPELAVIAEALGVSDSGHDATSAAIGELHRMATAVGVPETLAELGLTREELPELARQASTVTRLLRNSPRELDEASLLVILEAAHEGRFVDERTKETWG